MNTPSDADRAPAQALEVFEPQPDALYSLDMAARLAGVTRRSLLIYCRAGLVHPVLLPPVGAMAFSEEAIRTARRIEHLRVVHGLQLPLIRTLLNLLDEVERLRVEVRFLRNR
ncbi:MAG: helix-turn-helix domain-containing protein [Lentisphaerae bacterium]|nr:helix-turn-helix domain-containing protein [Lentisphaerota bacterium]